MNKLILSTLALILVSPLAQAKEVQLKGPSAVSFIKRHFPDADLPGDFKGTFTYTNSRGLEKRGYAECSYPAMGGASKGQVPTCDVIY